MSVAAPIIYSPPQIRQRLTLLGRSVALLIALSCLAPLVIGATLNPSRTGVDTHVGLGLKSCDFLRVTHLPCPSCGMTTSVAWFVRGNWLASIYIQPMGFVIGMLCAMIFWAALFIAITAKPAHRLLYIVPGIHYVIAFMGFGILGWAWKIFIHLRGIDGW